MEIKENISPNPDSITKILTLRYDPSLSTVLPKKTWQDFTESKNVSLGFIEESIVHSIREKISEKTNNIAIALSGGVDSTLVITLLRKTFPDLEIEAISIKFANSVDESQQAKKISEHFNANHHIISLENYLSELPKAISIIKKPFWDLHWYYVVKKAKSLSNLLASGDGGDELFGGYTFRYEKFLKIINSNSSVQDKIEAYLKCHERDRVPDQEILFGNKSNFSWDSIYETLFPYFDNSLSPLLQVFLADYNGKLLYNFSPVNQRIHNYFGIESIAPLLDEKIISLAPHIPSNSKYDQVSNLGKLPLRKILEKYGADIFTSKEKLGFNVNTLNLWKSYGQKLCKEFLLDSRISKDNWINNQWIEKYIRHDDLDIKYVNKFLGLLSFEIWYRLFITKEISSNTLLE